MKDWQLADKYLTEDEVLRDAIEKSRGKSKEVHELEAKEMAEAAAQMVKSLQAMFIILQLITMLEQKSDQLKSKDEIIHKIREQMSHQRELDSKEINRLQNELSLAAGTTLNKLQKIQENAGYQSYGGGNRYDKLTREELSRNLDEKDDIINQLQAEIVGQEKQLRFMKEQMQTLRDQNGDLEHELRQERQQIELKAKSRDLDKLKRDLQERDKILANLRKTIDDLNEKMVEYEVKNSNVTEDQKMLKIQEGLHKKEHGAELNKLKAKIQMIEGSRNEKDKENKALQVKQLELQETCNKLKKDNEELLISNKNARESQDNEVRKREKLQIQLNNVANATRIGNGSGGTGGKTYDQLVQQIKELHIKIVKIIGLCYINNINSK